jgi:hypothetical protein
MSTERHWSKFWWQDWETDHALRCCSLTAQGLWMRLLCLAHKGSPYGHVTIAGKPATNKQLALLCGVGKTLIGTLIGELEAHGVFSRTAEGVIFSRRMVRDEKTSEKGREYIAKRWNNERNDEPNKRNSEPCAKLGIRKTNPLKMNGNYGEKPNEKSNDETPNRDPYTLDAEAEADTEGEKERTPPSLRSGPPKEGGAKRTARGTRLAADWKPGEKERKFALSLSLDLDAVTEDFRDYWLAKPGAAATSIDWSMTWRRWCRKAAQQENRRPAARKAAAPDWWAG